jgi:hypothetical protein
MDGSALIKDVKKAWKTAKKKDLDCYDEVERVIEAAALSDYQRGYFKAKLEEIGNSLSSEQEDWLWEIEAVLKGFDND